MITYDSNLKIFYSSLINDEGYFSGFSTRDLKDGRKIENVLNFFQLNGVSFKKLVFLEQIHSTNISIYNSKTSDNVEKIVETDGIITREKNIILTVRTGDCCPLVFADKSKGVIGVSHQGWRGSVKRMAQKMVAKMVEHGANTKSIKVAIGPTVGECCYDIDEDRYYEFLEEFDGYSKEIFHRRNGKIHLNLTKLNYLLLLESGVLKQNIDYFPFCTKCDKDRFFSFRRDNKKAGFGEMFSFIIKSV
ncbi:MAG: hypothetical protein UR89_C0002G0007 [Candidatus Roizmanbacteria bacterium GW2011_GWA2_35_8]|uniref:Purine nucleoside phosphorylase n=1 Tax=Candidatus Roizmanbacteria bacterium GW2011_GWA2_35_8 TaxID=1618479 RepID=A0A0G0G6E8_9BACT|nr:MAG: hypothetical protein UR89_C0002G0007 [Candidatus Roizmanbacteria bacterium GW2011_GWA2_35_8]